MSHHLGDLGDHRLPAGAIEPMIGIPVLGINAVTFWCALRENGFTGPLEGGGRLLREH